MTKRCGCLLISRPSDPKYLSSPFSPDGPTDHLPANSLNPLYSLPLPCPLWGDLPNGIIGKEEADAAAAHGEEEDDDDGHEYMLSPQGNGEDREGVDVGSNFRHCRG